MIAILQIAEGRRAARPVEADDAAWKVICGQSRLNEFVALIHLGWPRQEKEPPERSPQADVVTYLQ